MANLSRGGIKTLGILYWTAHKSEVVVYQAAEY